MELDFSAIKAAGLSQKEFATLVGVSRLSVNRWCQGHPVTPKMRARIGALLLRLKAAARIGILPGALTTSARGGAEARRTQLDDALRRTDEAIAKRLAARG